MLVVNPIGNDFPTKLEFSYFNPNGEREVYSDVFETKEKALIHYSGVCYSYSLQMFDELKRWAKSNHFPLPAWTSKIVEMDPTSVALSLSEIMVPKTEKEPTQKIRAIRHALDEWRKIMNYLSKK